MGKDNELLRLERSIEQLLQRLTTVRDEKERLGRDLLAATTANQELRQQLETLREERQDMSSRVVSLIDRIDRWQTELSEEPLSAGKEDAGQPAAAEETGVTEEASATDQSEANAQRKQERDGGIQGTLFPR
ncbi:MAG: cell division protein ZapB [Desulfofustis sp.]|nr:cell division protein ZapB [Desulfofustis sp.]